MPALVSASTHYGRRHVQDVAVACVRRVVVRIMVSVEKSDYGMIQVTSTRSSTYYKL